MTLTISLKHNNQEELITVVVNDEQSIKGTLKVLTEAGIIDSACYNTVRSTRSKKRINIENTYKDGGIYNGDILVLE